MSLFMSSVVTPPASLPITVADADQELAAAVVEECERLILWRAIVAQTRLIVIDGPLPSRIELEPVSSVVSLTRWTPTDDAAVIDAASYSVVSRDPAGAIISPAPGAKWQAPERAIGSFALTYMAGWTVTPESAPGAGDAVNTVPASVQFMVERAVAFRAGSGLGGITIGSLKINVAPSYSTDLIPPEIAGHWPRLCLPDRACSRLGHEQALLTTERARSLTRYSPAPVDAKRRRFADALTARIAATKRSLTAGGMLQPVEWGVPGEPDIRGRRIFTYSMLDALIEQRPALDRGTLSTDRADNTVLTILDPLAISDSHTFRWVIRRTSTG